MTHILIADDEPSLRKLIEATVAGPETETTQVQNGAEALRLSQEVKFDLIILDWMMPQLTGIEVLYALRASPSTASIPVIMLTARGQTKDQEMALAMGATRYIMKPFSPLELLQSIQSVLPQPVGEHESKPRVNGLPVRGMAAGEA